MPCAQRVSGNRRIRGARLGRRLVSGAPLSPKGFGGRGLLTFDNRVFSMQPRKGTGLRGPVPRGGFPLLGKEAPLNRKELVDAVKKGDRVSLVGFGTFERRDRKARVARNPRSGEAVRVKATKVPVFRAGQSFRDVVAGKAAAPKLSASRATRTAAASASPAQRRRPRGTRGAVAHARTEAGPQSGSVRMFR